MNLEEKVKAYNLLPITSSMASFIKENYPMLRNVDSYDYVRFYKAYPYFYSKSYIEEHIIDELDKAFSRCVGMFEASTENRPDDAEPGILLGGFMPDGT